MIDALSIFKSLVQALNEKGVECHMATIRYLNKNKVAINCTLVMTTTQEIKPVLTPAQELEMGEKAPEPPEHSPIPQKKDWPGYS